MRAKFALAFCCLALASARAASVAFTVNATLQDTAVITGTMTIDTTGGTVTAVNLAVGAPDNLTFNTMAGSYQGSGGAAGYYVGVASGATILQLTMVTGGGGTLVGYAGGAINTAAANESYLGSPANPVVSGSLSSSVPPTISKAFSAATAPVNGTVGLTFTLSNPNASPLAGVNFTDNFPAFLVVANPNGLSTTCPSGTVTAVAGSPSISLTGLTLAASSSCTITANVTPQLAATFNNSVTVGSSAGTGNTASATLVALAAPTLTKSFADTLLTFVGQTRLTFTVGNPNPLNALNGIAFTDMLPGGLLVASPNGLTTNCPGGIVTAVTATNVISLSGLTLPANSSCTISVNVYGTVDGTITNTTSAVTSTNGGTGLPASATITVRRYMLYLWYFS